MIPQMLKIAVWNANGLVNHSQELKTFIHNQNLDIILISETHFTRKSYLKIPNYTIYNTEHPDGTAHGGAAIIIRNTIKHHEIEKFKHEHIQATNIIVDDWIGQITFSAIYCPPKHTIKKEKFLEFFDTLGTRFIAGGDYNAKHEEWGSRLNNPRGRELLKAMKYSSLQHLSTGHPTYWPSDSKKKPDLIDFCVTKGISNKYMLAEPSLDLSSDHTPIIISLRTQVINLQIPPTLTNKNTDWQKFSEILEKKISLAIPLKTEENIDEAVEFLTNSIQEACWKATPSETFVTKYDTSPDFIKQAIKEKRKLRKIWQNTRYSADKIRLNRATQELKKLLDNLRNESFQNYLKSLTPSEATNYSLWKATKRMKQPKQAIPPIRSKNGKWARSNKDKAVLFANHLKEVFQPHTSENLPAEEEKTEEFLNSPYQMSLPIKPFQINEVKTIIICNLKNKKAPGFDLITGTILKKLPDCALKLITYISNAILRVGYFPTIWKIAQIILIPKPGKPVDEVGSYRPISLLPALSKVFEKLFLSRLRTIINDEKLIPDHQFGFRQQHSTVEQVHRIVNKINQGLEEKKFCNAVFLDVTQAFDKVWHEGLLYKIKQKLPYNYYIVLKSYLLDRYFQVKFQEEQTSLFPISAGVPQGSILGPTLYLLYTADLPTSNDIVSAAFADDTAYLAIDNTVEIASERLQEHLTLVERWLKKWRIKVNESKSSHVTFTMRKDTCLPITLNNKILPMANEVKYLGMHLDRRLTWKVHIWNKRKQLGLKFRKLYWILGPKSQLSLESKLLLYKCIMKPIWTYGIQLWGTASNSNIEIIQRFQSKTLRTIVQAPWYVPNEVIHRDLNIKTVQSEVKCFSDKYQERLKKHSNILVTKLLETRKQNRRLKRFQPLDLSNRF